MPELFIRIAYDIDRDKAKIDTNVRSDRVNEMISEYLRTQIGGGEDRRKATERKVYHINLELELDGDVFRVSDDTGNRSLRDGILMRVAASVD